MKNDQGVEEMRMILMGVPDRPVRIDCDDMHLTADQMEIFDGHRVVATGNVLFESATNRVASERLEFDTKTRTGTFFNASGTVSMANRVDRSMFGTQEPDAMFRGEEIHKLGPDTYKIVDGAFTTCVQPTPRWEVVSGSVTLKVNDHALLTNSILRVKGVPVLYLPIFYYPVQEDDRATGFLIPVYGASTVRGQSLSNAFFWAISRSQDATFMHDWYSKTGQGYGGEYRYELGSGNRGNAEVNLLDEHAADYQQADGSVKTTAAAKNFLMRGGLSQALGAGLHARANVNYTSDLAVQQRYQQNILQTNNRTRNIGGNVTGSWRGNVLSATAEKNDVFYDEDSLTSTGGLPRISFNRGERPIGRSKIYFGVNTEYVTQLYRTEQEGKELYDRGLTRMDVNPVVRIPFTKWPFLTLNSTMSWRDTYWTESLNTQGVQIPDSVNRQFFDLQARITGPVFNRIFETPNSGYATKFKHVIEPTVVIQRVTGIDVFNRIVQIDGADSIVGGTTRVTYGLNNRLYAKKDSAREIVSLGHHAELLFERHSFKVRFSVSEQLQRSSGAEELLSGAHPVTRVADGPVQRRLFHRVQLDGAHVHDVHRERQLQQQPVPGDRRLERAALPPGLPGVRQPGARPITTSTPPPRFATRATIWAAPTRSTTTSATPTSGNSASWPSTTRSAAASTSSIRPTIWAAHRASWSLRINGSISRSRSPASGRSPTSSAPSAARRDGNRRTMGQSVYRSMLGDSSDTRIRR